MLHLIFTSGEQKMHMFEVLTNYGKNDSECSFINDKTSMFGPDDIAISMYRKLLNIKTISEFAAAENILITFFIVIDQLRHGVYL